MIGLPPREVWERVDAAFDRRDALYGHAETLCFAAALVLVLAVVGWTVGAGLAAP